MAVPKRKTSKARRDKRRANWKLEVPGMAECPKCHEMKLSHRICKNRRLLGDSREDLQCRFGVIIHSLVIILFTSLATTRLNS